MATSTIKQVTPFYTCTIAYEFNPSMVSDNVPEWFKQQQQQQQQQQTTVPLDSGNFSGTPAAFLKLVLSKLVNAVDEVALPLCQKLLFNIAMRVLQDEPVFPLLCEIVLRVTRNFVKSLVSSSFTNSEGTPGCLRAALMEEYLRQEESVPKMHRLARLMGDIGDGQEWEPLANAAEEAIPSLAGARYSPEPALSSEKARAGLAASWQPWTGCLSQYAVLPSWRHCGPRPDLL